MNRAVARELTTAGLGLVAAMTLATLLLAVPLATQEPFAARSYRVESVPAAPNDSGLGVSGQAVMERAGPNEVYFIDILFFYTDGFADDFVRLGRSMSDEIWQSVSLLNAALANSRVKATVRIVGVEQLPGMPDDQEVAIRMIVEDDNAIRRRNALGADLVYALVDDRAGFLGQACEPHSEAGFSAESCFWGSVNNFCGGGGLGCDDVWRTVLRHEVGHKLGIQHSPEAGGDPGGGFRKGAVGYSSPLPNTDPKWYGTVMGANWLPRFSTSSERYQGFVVGEPGVHEASTALQYSTVAVSRYRESVPEPRERPPLQPGEYTDCIPQSSPLTLGLHPVFNPAGRYRDGYRVSMCYETYDGNVGDGHGGLWSLGESGLLWFFERDNAEVLIKVLDGCGVNGHRWVFVAPVTDLAFNMRIDGLDFGSRWTYRNHLGATASARSDTSAFPCTPAEVAAAKATSSSRGNEATFDGVELVQTALPVRLRAGARTDCEPGGPVLTLSGGYSVSMCYETYEGQSGDARDGGLDSSQSALLYFFERNNVEVLIKVLDGCGVNGHRWVFVAPVTDLAFNLHVESPTGERWTHTNRLGQTADTAADTSAFPCASSV